MRAIGLAERALSMMVERTSGRVAFGKPLIDQGVIRQWIADARMEIEQARLLVLKTAWLMDTGRQQGRADRDLGDQGASAPSSPAASSITPSRRSGRPASRRTSSSPS